MVMRIPPLIGELKPHNAQLLDEYLLMLPTDTSFGNMRLKYRDIVQRFDLINDKILDVYAYFIKINETKHEDPIKNALINTALRPRYNGLIEEVTYWLRKSADELITLVCFFLKHEEIGKFPTSLDIDCVGALLKHSELCDQIFPKCSPILSTLNEISNAHKHSFINTEVTNYIGSECPVVFALALKYNKMTNEPKFHTLDLFDVVINYSSFLSVAKKQLTRFGQI